jgi:hypothetical protein
MTYLFTTSKINTLYSIILLFSQDIITFREKISWKNQNWLRFFNCLLWAYATVITYSKFDYNFETFAKYNK